MKIKFILFFLIVFNVLTFAINFNDMSNDAVLTKVGDYNVTMLDLKVYMAGYKSIKQWDSYSIANIITKIVFDLLYLNACVELNLKVSDLESTYYARNFFKKRSINPDNPKSLDLYFKQNDPYGSLEDFFNKSTLYLHKIKYLAYKGYLKTTKSYKIFFSTAGLSKEKKQKLKENVQNITRQIMDGYIFFDEAFKQYDDKKTNMDIGIIENNAKTKNVFSEQEIDRILKAGLFSPIFCEGNNGFYIIMNYEYIFPDDEELITKVTDELATKYEIVNFISFSEK